METINDRIAVVVENSGMTKTAFAAKINVSQPHVSRMVKGEALPSDRTISDICEKFGVNEVWLRTGAGEMMRPSTKNEQLAKIFASVQVSDDERARLIKAFASLPEEAYPQIYKWFMQIVENLKAQE